MGGRVVYNVQESYAEHKARRNVQAVGLPLLGFVFIAIGVGLLYLGISSGEFTHNLKDYLQPIFMFLLLIAVGVAILIYWWRKQRYSEEVLERSRNAPITRISYG